MTKNEVKIEGSATNVNIQNNTKKSKQKIETKSVSTIDWKAISEFLEQLDEKKKMCAEELNEKEAGELNEIIEGTQTAIKEKKENKVKEFLGKLGDFALRIGETAIGLWIKAKLTGMAG